MRLLFLPIAILLSFFIRADKSYSQTFDFDLDWATYFGDESLRYASNAIDSQGNIYFAGAVFSYSLFETNANSFQANYGGGFSDGFLAKMSPEGELLWSTYIGGESTDYITGITIDESDNVYVLGSTSSNTGIATPNSYQANREGNQELFIAKFSSEGMRVWSTYYPFFTSGSLSGPGLLYVDGFDIVADKKGFIYFFNNTDKDDLASPGTFQVDKGGDSNYIITKFNTNGERIWSTYYGIYRSRIISIAVGEDGLYVAGLTNDLPPHGSPNTYFATEASHQSIPGDTRDVFLTKFSLEGEREWSTYYGNNHPEFFSKGGLLVNEDFVYLTGTSSGNQGDISTPGAHQEESGNGPTLFLVKFNNLGVRQWGTYIGETIGNWSITGVPHSYLSKDSLGNTYLYGTTVYLDNITTPTAYQSEIDEQNSTFLSIFNPDGELEYGTYFGSNKNEYAAAPLNYENTFYLFGRTYSDEGISTSESFQPDYMENSDINNPIGNLYIAKFIPKPLGINDYKKIEVSVFPNPNRGDFILQSNEIPIKKVYLYNFLGQLIKELEPEISQNTISIKALSSGQYLALVILENNHKGTLKVIVE